eukprot:scaffold313946_cov31-Tisochrysis_lutea.AAC.2
MEKVVGMDKRRGGSCEPVAPAPTCSGLSGIVLGVSLAILAIPRTDRAYHENSGGQARGAGGLRLDAAHCAEVACQRS